MRILSIITAACALALSATTALAQTTQFYGPSGQYQGSANRFGNTTTFYGPAGQYQGNANTFGNTTTYYGSTGQYQGSSNSFGGGLNNNFGNNSRRGFGGF